MQNYYMSSRDENPPQDTNNPIAMETNSKYVYVKQNFVPTVQGHTGSKVLVNPLFNKKVFVNPNYHILPPSMSTKIHINPRMKTDLSENIIKSNIHINPKVLRNIPITESNYSSNCLQNQKAIEQPPSKPAVVTPQKTIRRKSICSKFKIVRSTYSQLSTSTCIEQSSKTATIVLSPKRVRRSVYSKFKIVRSTYPYSRTEGSNRKQHNTRYKFSRKVDLSQTQKSLPRSKIANIYKVDNRNNINISLSPSKNKFVFINRFLIMSDIAKTRLLKTNRTSKSNIGIRASTSKKTSPQKILRVQNTTISKSKYKFVRRTPLPPTASKGISKVQVSPGKMKKCNIPCSYYRKFGRCKGKDNGKCNRKHDPDQIALCTKFLQGACIDDKCLLSHDLSPEKMPTCRFYLEGNCTRDDCPYLHVRISPTADICRDFLEGYCKKASKCDKRHQFLCPDYEKRGCAKVRCPYPHGKMVRKYSLLNRNKFAKKSSDNVEANPSEKCINDMKEPNQILSTEELAINPASSNKRYYAEGKMKEQQNIDESENHVDIENNKCDHYVGFRSRPKLGELPSYIAFEEL